MEHDRAVVLGGSLTGLLAARVLADRYGDVIVVDRDDLAGSADVPRRGVPQGRHTHGLLVGGLRAIERLLPGFSEALKSRGALECDVARGVRWVFDQQPLAASTSGLVGLVASRPLVESAVRARVRDLTGVSLLGGHDVVGLLDDGAGRVVGVRVAERDAAGADRDLAADLVVDATGRGSRAPAWLVDLGFPAPAEDRVDIGISYVTRLFSRDPTAADFLGAISPASPPCRNFGVVLAQEGDRWAVTLGGYLGVSPPADLPGFTAFADALPGMPIGDLVRSAQPLDDALVHRFPSSHWRRYDRCPRLPAGLVVIGDAVASFNPAFGQGMTSAALQVEALQDCLAADSDAGLPARVAQAAAKVVAVPWMLAVGIDRRFPGMPRKPLTDRALDLYLDRLLRVAHDDSAVALAFLQVLNLVASPSSLLTGSVARRVLFTSAGRAASRKGPRP